MAPVVEAYQALRGASFLVAEIGDVRRFDTPRQLMAFLGLVPAERSTGDTVRRKGLTLAGNRRARRALIEAAWTYRYPARVSETLRARLEGPPKPVRDIAWKAQVRLCARYRRLSATGKKLPVVVVAIGREAAPATEGDNQPADQSLINRRLSLHSQPCAAMAFLADGELAERAQPRLTS
jgi:transposase